MKSCVNIAAVLCAQNVFFKRASGKRRDGTRESFQRARCYVVAVESKTTNANRETINYVGVGEDEATRPARGRRTRDAPSAFGNRHGPLSIKPCDLTFTQPVPGFRTSRCVEKRERDTRTDNRPFTKVSDGSMRFARERPQCAHRDARLHRTFTSCRRWKSENSSHPTGSYFKIPFWNK